MYLDSPHLNFPVVDNPKSFTKILICLYYHLESVMCFLTVPI